MTLPVQNPIVIYVGNGVTTAFAFPFTIFAAEDLVVLLGNVEQAAGYTVTGVGEDSGTAIFTAPPAVGVLVALARDTSLERDTDYQDNGDLLAPTLNKDFDRIWGALQESGLNLTRAIRVPFESSGQGTMLPLAAQRAGKAVILDQFGNIIVSQQAWQEPQTVLDEAKAVAEVLVAGVAPGAGTGTFIQNGVGGAIRTFQAKMRDFSVTPEDYFLAGEANQSGMIQRAIDAVSAAGGGSVMLYRPLYRAAGLILKTGVGLGSNLKDAVIIKAPDGWNATSVIDTALFDTYKFTAGVATDANTPNGCGLFNLVVDGNAENFGGVASALAGYGVRFGSVRPIIDNVRIVAAPGTGLHTSLGSITRLTTDWYRRDLANGYVRNLSIYGSRNDGWVHDGPGDLYIESADIGVSGFPDTAAYAAAFPSLLEPGRRVANFVANTAVEIGWMHTFGCTQGWDFIGGRPSYGTGTIRIKFGTLIAESGNGGVWMREGAYYQGDILDMHNNFGHAGAEYFRADGVVLQGHINNVQVDLGSNNNGQNIIALLGQFKSIGNLAVDGRYFSSQALVVGGVQNKVHHADIARIGPAGAGKTGVLAAIRILASASEWTVNATVRDSDIIALMETGAGQPVDSHIVGGFLNGATDFVGFSALTTSQRRNILLHNLSGDKRSRGYVGISAPITATSLAIQTFDVPIVGLFTPKPEEIQVSLMYVSGTMATLAIPPTVNLNSSAAGNLRVILQFAQLTDAVVQIVASVP